MAKKILFYLSSCKNFLIFMQLLCRFKPVMMKKFWTELDSMKRSLRESKECVFTSLAKPRKDSRVKPEEKILDSKMIFFVKRC